MLLFLPADFFDHSTIDTCLSVIIFDRNCPACGMTRAFQHLIHLDFAAAAHFNKLSFIVFPIITFVWILELRKAFRYIKAHKSK